MSELFDGFELDVAKIVKKKENILFKKKENILFRECDPSSGGGNSSNTNDCITGKLCTTTCPGFTQLICIGNYKIR